MLSDLRKDQCNVCRHQFGKSCPILDDLINLFSSANSVINYDYPSSNINLSLDFVKKFVVKEVRVLDKTKEDCLTCAMFIKMGGL